MPRPTLLYDQLGPTPVDILSRDIHLVFDSLPQFEQLDAVEQLQRLILSVKYDGSVGHLRFLGMFQEDYEDADLAKIRLLGMCYWQLVMFLRYSTPTRISEAAPYLTFILTHFDDVHGKDKNNAVVWLYLGESLHKTKGKTQEAFEAFKKGFKTIPPDLGPRTELWARANMCRLLRDMGRTYQAEEHEAFIRLWLKTHPYTFPPNVFKSLVTDKTHSDTDYIYDHPDVKQCLHGIWLGWSRA